MARGRPRADRTARPPGSGQLLLALASAAVPTDGSGLAPGRWYSAHVVECGADTEPFRPGDLVSVCHDDGGHPVLATAMTVEASACLLAPEGLTADAAALAGPAAAAHVIARRALPPMGSDVMIVGLGLLGAFLTAVLVGEASWVRVVDPQAERRLVAAMLGAAEGCAGAAGTSTPATFETLGRTDTLWQALASTRDGGSVVSVAEPLPAQEDQAARRHLHLRAGAPGTGRRHHCAGLSLVAEQDHWGVIAARAVPFGSLTGDGLRARGPEELAVLVDPSITTSRPSRFFRSPSG